MAEDQTAGNSTSQSLPPDVAPVHDSVLANGTVIKGYEETPTVPEDKKSVSG